MQTDYFLFVSLDMISAILCLKFSNSSSISAFVSLCDEIVLIEALSGPKTTGVAPLSSLFETDLFTFHEKSFSRPIQITHNINYFDVFTHYAIAFLNIISKDCIVGKSIFNIRSVLIIDREKTQLVEIMKLEVKLIKAISHKRTDCGCDVAVIPVDLSPDY